MLLAVRASSKKLRARTCERSKVHHGARGQLASPTGFEDETPRKPSSEPVDQTRKDNELREESDDGNRQE
jgi:hypothetical protein